MASKDLTLFIDTETSGFPLYNLSISDARQPNLLQFAAIMDDQEQKTILRTQFYLKPIWKGEVPEEAKKIHGIDRALLDKKGINPEFAHNLLISILSHPENILVVAHNAFFDMSILFIFLAKMHQYINLQKNNQIKPYIYSFESINKIFDIYCTMLKSTGICKIPNPWLGITTNNPYKWPSLNELFEFCFGETRNEKHDALIDVADCRYCYYEMIDEEKEKEMEGKSEQQIKKN